MRTVESITVGELARLAGITVRTLHHYDDIGLVTPSGRTAGGYRNYGRDEVERLQEVLFFRELGFSLEEIKEMVERSDYNRLDALARQRQLLEAQTDHLLAMVDAVDRAIQSERTGIQMTSDEMLEVFGDFDPTLYEDEVKERWGTSDAYKQSAERTKRYTRDDWQQMRREADAINQRFLALMARDVEPDDPAAMDVAEAHREHITKWFYDCSREIHAGLGQMYVEDERFRQNIDAAGAGLAGYMAAAITANVER